MYGATAVRRQGWTSPENPDTFVGCRIPARGQHSPITVSDENELGTNDSDSYEDNDGSSADNEYDTDLDLQEGISLDIGLIRHTVKISLEIIIKE